VPSATTNRLIILVTNVGLAETGGTQVVVRDLSLGLLRRGHHPVVYAPTLGNFAKAIVARGVPVIDDLRQLRETPDIIHGQHLIPCSEALIRFPDVPAVYVCHGFASWMGGPPHFPQIGAYVAVDDACRDRLVQADGIESDKVVVLRNAVDLSRIPQRPQPARNPPQRALAFGKAAIVPELWAACEKIGLPLDAIGHTKGSVLDHPEQQLVNYDLVFASARAALEALCCGCAVIVCDHRGLSGLVTSQNLDALRAVNFGIRALTRPLSADALVDEIRRCDEADIAAVTTRARQEANLETWLDRVEQLYDDVVNGSRKPSADTSVREAAEARFLYENLPRRPGDYRWPWLAERDKLQRDNDALTKHGENLRLRIVALEGRLREQERELIKLKIQRDAAAKK
jgi:hypothetical protein